MSLTEPAARMSARGPQEYAALARAGVSLVVEPAGGPGPLRCHAGSFEDEFAALLRWEPRRAGSHGVRHLCALGLHGRQCHDPGLVEAVLWILGRLLPKEGVAAVGELGLDEGAALEEEALARQLELARRLGLPVLVRAPGHEGERGVQRALALLRASGLPGGSAAVLGAPEPLLPAVLDAGAWVIAALDGRCGPRPEAAARLVRRLGLERVMISGGADRRGGDALAVPAAAAALAAGGFEAASIERLLGGNPAAFYRLAGGAAS